MIHEKLGRRVRTIRNQKGLTQEELCRLSGLSRRYLSQIEKGTGNLSLERLIEIAQALNVSICALFMGLGPVMDDIELLVEKISKLNNTQRASLSDFLGGPHKKIALIGLRGAGKSTIGRKVAADLGWQFFALDDRVQKSVGMSLGEIFEYHGPSAFREYSRGALEEILREPEPLVIEVGGSLVFDRIAYGSLLAATTVVWLKASPQAHLMRVTEQGDRRPMDGWSDPLKKLKRILATRETLYEKAHVHIDTEEYGIENAATHIRQFAGFA